MGRSSSKNIEYSYARGEKIEGQTRIYRHPFYKTRAINDNSFLTQPQIFTTPISMKDVLLASFNKYKDKDMLCFKSKERNISSELKAPKGDPYMSRKYFEGNAISRAIIKFIEKNKLFTDLKCTDGTMLKTIGVLSKNREEWLLLDFACQIGGYVLVAINDQFTSEDIKQVCVITKIVTIFCSESNLKTLSEPEIKELIPNIVCFDEINTQGKEPARKGFYSTWANVLKETQDTADNELPPSKPSDIMTIVFTRNFKGQIKAVLLSHENFTSAITAIEKTDIKMTKDDIYLSYLPISSIYERVNLLIAVFFGATIYFSSGNILKLREEMQEVSPTVFAAVPRFYERLYKTQKTEKKTSGCRGYMEKKALKNKKKKLKENNKYSDTVNDALFFNDKRKIFGKRIRLLISGSAKLNPKVANYLRVTASCPLVEGYGCTQSTSVIFLTNQNDREDSQIGGPLLNCEFKLVDPPESFLQGKKRLLTAVRGELCIRGACCSPGVLEGQGRISREGFDQEGFFHTGDYAEMNLEKGSLKIIDRIADHFKLNNGEFVSPIKLEEIYKKCEKIKYILVYGDSSRSECIAIVNLSNQAVNEKKTTISKETINKIAIKEEFEALADSHRLSPSERINEIYIEEADLNAQKLVYLNGEIKRREAIIYFRQIIEKIYKELK